MQTKPSFQKRRTAYSLNTKTVRTALAGQQLFSRLESGFISFANVNVPSVQDTTRDLSSSLRVQPRILNSITSMLSENKIRLSKITKKVNQKQAQQYNNYLNNNNRYCKLLELNNNKSRLLTSLNTKVGQIKIKLIQQHKPQDFQYIAQFTRIPAKGWIPESREGQLCVVFRDNMILMGGHNSEPLGKVCVFNFKNNSWTKAYDLDVQRSYHTGVMYKQHYILIFGGMSKYNEYFKTRQCLNTLSVFSPITHGIKQIKIENQSIVEPRRSHGAVVVGKQMIILGGINTHLQYLNDIKYLDLRELKWKELDYKIENPDLEQFLIHGIAKHVMVANFKQRQGHFKLHHKDYQSHQGVFIFGGVNQVGLKSIVIQISLKKRVARVYKLHPSGHLPSGINTIVQRVSENLIAVVSGDRSERQIKLYKVKENQFINVHYNSPLLGGVGSSIVGYKNQMYIFFGVGQQGYIGGLSRFKIEQKLKSQLDKDAKKQRRHTLIHRQNRIFPNFFSNQIADRSL